MGYKVIFKEDFEKQCDKEFEYIKSVVEECSMKTGIFFKEIESNEPFWKIDKDDPLYSDKKLSYIFEELELNINVRFSLLKNNKLNCNFYFYIESKNDHFNLSNGVFTYVFSLPYLKGNEKFEILFVQLFSLIIEDSLKYFEQEKHKRSKNHDR